MNQHEVNIIAKLGACAMYKLGENCPSSGHFQKNWISNQRVKSSVICYKTVFLKMLKQGDCSALGKEVSKYIKILLRENSVWCLGRKLTLLWRKLINCGLNASAGCILAAVLVHAICHLWCDLQIFFVKQVRHIYCRRRNTLISLNELRTHNGSSPALLSSKFKNLIFKTWNFC